MHCGDVNHGLMLVPCPKHTDFIVSSTAEELGISYQAHQVSSVFENPQTIGRSILHLIRVHCAIYLLAQLWLKMGVEKILKLDMVVVILWNNGKLCWPSCDQP